MRYNTDLVVYDGGLWQIRLLKFLKRVAEDKACPRNRKDEL